MNFLSRLGWAHTRRAARTARTAMLGLVVPALCWLPSTGAAADATRQAVMNVRDFGAVGDGVKDDWWPFQQAINAAARQPGGGVVLVPPAQAQGSWRISHALRLYSQVTIRVTQPSTRILCAGDAKPVDETGAKEQGNWVTAGCLLLGAMSSSAVNTLPTLPLLPSRKGQQEVMLAKPADGQQLAVGDLVTLEASGQYRLNANGDALETTRPSEMQMQRIEALLPSGAVRLRYPLDRSGLTVLRRLTNQAQTPGWPTLKTTQGGDTGIALFASFQSGVEGGTWETSRPLAAFISTGGALECALHPHTVKAGFGVGYGNLFARCHMSADEQVIARVPVELAFHSERNQVQLGSITTTTTAELRKGDGAPRWYVGINESSRYNQVSIERLVIRNSEPDADHPTHPLGTDVVLLAATQCNHLRIDHLQGVALPGSVVHVASPRYPGAAPVATGNTIDIGETRLSAQRSLVQISGPNTNGNLVQVHQASGEMRDVRARTKLLAPEAGENDIVLPTDAASAQRRPAARCALDD